MKKIENNIIVKQTFNKTCFSNLNFNLISEIIKFIPILYVLEVLVDLNKNTLKAINNSQLIKIIKTNFQKLILKADFETNNLTKIKQT